MAKIMIVDDAMFMRATLKKILTGGGHEVVAEADNGVAAVENYEAFKPELVFMDITMPQKDGIGALTDIMGKYPDARIVMCSALGQESKVREAIEIGAREYIVKPFTPDKILDVVKRMIS
jgi:two-component system chemotaxis response regulator CheY